MISHSSRRDPLQLVLGPLEQQLVVHLQQHVDQRRLVAAGTRATRIIAILTMSLAEPWMGALTVARIAALRTVQMWLSNLGEVAPAPEQRLGVAVVFGLADHRVLERFDRAEPLEVALDEAPTPRAAGRPVRSARPKVAHAVQHAVVDHLGHPPIVGRDLLERHAEHFGGGDRVRVFALGERLEQRRIFGQVGQHAQLDLAVVG